MSSTLNILAMNWSVGNMEYIREAGQPSLSDRRQLEIQIEAAQLAIARLKETPYQASLEQKLERLAELQRVYAESFGAG